MEAINQISNAFIVLIEVGIVVRIIFCMMNSSTNENERDKYIARAKNALVFGIIASIIFVLKDLALYYYH